MPYLYTLPLYQSTIGNFCMRPVPALSKNISQHIPSLLYNMTVQSYSNLGVLSYYKPFFWSTVILKAAKSAVILKTAVLTQGLLVNSPIYTLDYNAC